MDRGEQQIDGQLENDFTHTYMAPIIGLPGCGGLWAGASVTWSDGSVFEQGGMGLREGREEMEKPGAGILSTGKRGLQVGDGKAIDEVTGQSTKGRDRGSGGRTEVLRPWAGAMVRGGGTKLGQ